MTRDTMIRHIKKLHYHIKRHVKKPRHNRHHEVLAAFIVALFVSTHILVPYVGAASLMNSKDTLSSSGASQTSDHNIIFTTNLSLGAGDKIRVTFPTEFTNIIDTNVTCPGSSTSTVVGQDVICIASGLIASGTQAIYIASVVNPATSTSYMIRIQTQNSANNTIEQSDVQVAITERVVMTATVSSTLVFTVSSVNADVTINGIATKATSTATSTPFGELTVGASSTVAQELSVITNAASGYVVTVEQDQELHNPSGANINSFDNSADGTGSTTPHAWSDPSGILDQTQTYGHMGLTTDDSNLGTTDTSNDSNYNFASSKFVGLNGTSTQMIMKHTGPADGATQDKGNVKVLFALQISALQEAGEYTNTLTYICTPTY